MTGGNSDTRSYNISLTASYDPKRKNSVKADALYLRADTDGAASVDKTAVNLRDEYRLNGRSFVFGELRYLRDVFKDIRHLVSPLAGFGYTLADGARATLSVDVALGGQFEKDADRARTNDGAAQAGQRLAVKLSPTATLSQRGSALWKLGDLGDALYHFELGIAASISRRTELRLSFSDDYKSRPSDPRRQRNDTSLVAALVFKIG